LPPDEGIVEGGDLGIGPEGVGEVVDLKSQGQDEEGETY
jgi:hypothetical protein